MATIETASKTQLTIDISRQLAEQLNSYLLEHPNESIETLLHEALYVRQVPEEPHKFLELAGFIKNVPGNASQRPEDTVS
ncbi:MAG: hypothetical protein AAFR58_07555 [Cyanobacteria bacterium J06627_28]